MSLSRVFHKTDFIFYIVVFVCFFFLERQYIQVHEDLDFVFSLRTGQYIDSFSDAVDSQLHGYLYSNNGRVLVHSLVQYFCACSNKIPYFLLTSLMFVLLNMGLVFHVRQSFPNQRNDKYWILFLLVLLMPLFGTTFIGHIAFVINYLWTSAIIVWFLSVFYACRSKSVSLPLGLALGLFALISGAMQESFSIGISGALFFYYIFHKNEFNGAVVYLVVGFLIGSVLVVCAPANFNRFLSSQASSEVSLIVKYVKQCGRVIVGGIWCFVLLLASLCWSRTFKGKRFCSSHWLEYLSLVLSLLFTMVVAYTARHQLTFVVIVTILLGYKILLIDFAVFFNSKAFRFILPSLLVLWYVPTCMARQHLQDSYEMMVENAQESKDGIVVGADVISFDSRIRNSFLEEYTNVLHSRSQLYYSDGVRLLSRYLFRDDVDKSVTKVLPDTKESIISQCNADNKLHDNVYRDVNKPYFVLTTSTDNDVQIVNVTRIPYSFKAKLESYISNICTSSLPLSDFATCFEDNGVVYWIVYEYDFSNDGWRIQSVEFV